MTPERHQSAVAADFRREETNGKPETSSQVFSLWKDIEHETLKRQRIHCKKLVSQ